MSFRDDAIYQLRHYKEDVLHNNDIVYTKRKDGTPKPQYHILSDPKAELNFSSEIKIVNRNNLLIQLEGHPTKFTLHKDWAHLNSSQVLCINYFYKYINDASKLKALLNVWHIDENPISAEFEFKAKDGSHIDFVIHLANGKNVFCEVKYTEGKFAPAKLKDNKDGAVIDRRPIYIERKSLYSNVDIEMEDYFIHYQAVRNIHYGDDGNYTVFLFPYADSDSLKNMNDAIKCIKNINCFEYRVESWEHLLELLPDKEIQDKYFWYMKKC